MDLFDHHRQHLNETSAPLAARMRPRTLDEFIGQDAIIGPGRLLRRAIAADQLSSLIFYGPPGTGKTTLAQIIANTTQAHFIAINAVLAGVKELRGAIAEAQTRQGQYSQRSILFVDEVHRFNKAQQDALLPWVENGTIVLIGATTENPYFEVNKALVSRSRLFQLQSLHEVDLRRVIHQALQDRVRGYGDRAVHLEPSARDHLVNIANGDARTLLNALELAVETTLPQADGRIEISLAVAEESIQRRAVLYDKEGDAHFDTISALIKSVRGSDCDAALYWLARMVYSGEDPRFIFRRLIILASEDIGLADPQAVGVVVACATAFDRIGLPEGQYPLAQATLYLANAPKSNSILGFFEALKNVEHERTGDVPNPLKDDSRDQHLGHGAGYKYPHAYRDHWVAQQYLPGGLQGQVFYQPSDQGWEGERAVQVAQRREAQMAALSEGGSAGKIWGDDAGAMPEVLSFGPVNRDADRWLQRALSQSGKQLGQLRDRLFDLAQCQRHHLVLDANAGSGLLTWEAIRRVPEGGVYAQTATEAEAEQLRSQAQDLPELLRPMIWVRGDREINRDANSSNANSPTLPVSFDRILGRNLLVGTPTAIETQVKEIVLQLAPQGRLVWAEPCPRESQRLSAWLPQNRQALQQQLNSAETAFYAQIPQLSWGPESVRCWFEATDVELEAVELVRTAQPMVITQALIDRWFDDRPHSYATRLATQLSPKIIEQVRQAFVKHLLGETRELRGAIAWIVARRD